MAVYSFKFSASDGDAATIVVRNAAGAIVSTGTLPDDVAITNEAFLAYTADLPTGDTYTATATVNGRSRTSVGVLDASSPALSATFAAVEATSGLRRVQNDVPAPLSTDLADWSAAGFGTAGVGLVSIVERVGFKGTPALTKKWTTAATDVGINSGPNITTAGAALAPVSGTTPRVGSLSVEVFDTPGDVVVQRVEFFYDASKVFLSQWGGDLFTVRANQAPARLPGPVVKIPTGAAYMAPGVRIWTASQMGTGTIRVSAPQVEAATTAGPFKHGDMPGATWAGTRNASSSSALLGTTERYAAYGDSHFGQADGGGVTTPDYLTETLGREVFNGGRGGETSTGIAIRAGALPLTVSVTGGNIPAAATAVGVTVSGLGPNPVLRTGTSWTFPGEIGGIDGTLTVGNDGVTWTFTRNVAGTQTAVANGSAFTPYRVATATDIWFIQAGANLPDYSRVLYDVAAMTAKCDSEGRDYVILPLYNNSSEPAGSANYVLLASINAELKRRYPQRYVDTRRFLIDKGLAAAGVTATTDDATAISEDRIPPSLLSGTIHLGPAGRRVVAAYVGQFLRNRNLLKPDAAMVPNPLGSNSGPQLVVPPASLFGNVAPAAWAAANFSMANAFSLQQKTTLRYVNFRVGVASGNVQAGIVRITLRDANFVYYTRVMNSGVLACPASGHVSLDCGATVLEPGEYAVFLWADNTTVTLPYVPASAQGALDGRLTLDLGSPAGGVPASGNTGGGGKGYTAYHLSAVTATAFA